jgi:ABC-2 type transport system ATP-binding protein
MVLANIASGADSSDGFSTPDPAVVVDRLIKRYAGREVVRDLSFEVRRGEVFALLGPNGAGKTTTIEILEGFREADEGQVLVLGENPASSRSLKQRVGMMPQQSSLYPQITVREAITLFCAYYQAGAAPAALLDLVGLGDRADDRFKTLSGGEKQRLSLGLAMAGNPELIFLDEPTAAMDPRARQTTWDLITELRAGGVTIVLTTHYLEEANRLADRVAIIDHGRLVGLGAPSELTHHSGGIVRFFAAPAPAVDMLLRLPGVTNAQEERPGFYRLDSADPDELLIEVAVWSRANAVRVRDLRIERATLEEVFLQLTEEEARR